MTPRVAHKTYQKTWLVTASVLAYAALVLAADTLAMHGVRFIFDWRIFQWSTANGADLFKFVAWFVVPFVLCLPWMDWGYFGVKRWRRIDYVFLAGLAVVAVLTVLTILLFPTLRATYPSAASLSAHAKWSFLAHNVTWTLSWLIGWEFLHRYFLLRPLAAQWPRFGWLLIPVYEGVYHLQKPLLEAAGMVAFSLALTYWALNRRNALLPFLAHLMVELSLIIFLVLV